MVFFIVFFFKQKTAYEMRISDWSSDVCSSDLSQLYRFSNSTYMELLQNNGKLTFALLGKLCIRLHQRINEIETLSLKNATHRVVRYLLTQLAQIGRASCRERVCTYV